MTGLTGSKYLLTHHTLFRWRFAAISFFAKKSSRMSAVLSSSRLNEGAAISCFNNSTALLYFSSMLIYLIKCLSQLKTETLNYQRSLYLARCILQQVPGIPYEYFFHSCINGCKGVIYLGKNSFK